MPNTPNILDKISRRSVLQFGAVGCSSALIGAMVPAQALPAHQMTSHQWQQLIGQKFQIKKLSFQESASFQPATIRLIDVTVLETKSQGDQGLPSGVQRETLAISFLGDRAVPIASGTYDVWHRAWGMKQLFINEVSHPRSQNTRLFEVILN